MAHSQNRNNDDVRVGELLVREKHITPAALARAKSDQQRQGGSLVTHLIRHGAVSADVPVRILAEQYRLPVADLAELGVDQEAAKLIPAELARKHQVIAFARSGRELSVATSDPANAVDLIKDLGFLTGYTIVVHVSAETAVSDHIRRLYDTGDVEVFREHAADAADDVEAVAVEEEDATIIDPERSSREEPIIRLVNGILYNAVRSGASDIHLEPFERKLLVRYRIDGVLHDHAELKPALAPAVASRLKVLARLKLDERRIPQDGRVKLAFGAERREVDFRVSVLPTLYGEKIVLRLLDKSGLQADMTKLGFDPEQLEWFREAINQPDGIVLVTGPTGSGKTTTLYSALAELNRPGVNISTAEDPIEYQLDRVNQVQVNAAIDLTFANALRAFLRQDPDIIMVGEIRDYETAEISFKAAQTGHLVLSTIHTNSAPATVKRLMDMGAEEFLIAASLNMIVAQRLVRKICNECKEPVPYDEGREALETLGMKDLELAHAVPIYRGRGCAECHDGYKSRIALYEVLRCTEAIRDLIAERASVADLKLAAVQNGMKTLRGAGIEKILQGVTTAAEVSRVTRAD